MSFEELNRLPHRRFNPLLREWVLVSPHRTQRPWLGRVEKVHSPASITFDPNCYLCPGNRRAGGAQTPEYAKTYVFDNDYPAMLPDVARLQFDRASLLVGKSERGVCRVMCFSPRHDLSVPRMSARELRGVVDGWVDQYSALGQIPWIRHVQIFENRGEMMGASNPHPHCQIWANDVPFWAVWPFESLVLTKRHVASIDQLSGEERDLLSDIMKRITIRYDNLFETAFPYSMGFHQKPTDGRAYEEWHLHAHYFPPLLRSATIQKFMVGYELLGTPQRDLTPEAAVNRLRDAGEIHYVDRS